MDYDNKHYAGRVNTQCNGLEPGLDYWTGLESGLDYWTALTKHVHVQIADRAPCASLKQLSD